MGYDEKMIEYASTKYEISYIDSERFLHKIRLEYQRKPRWMRAFFKAFKPARSLYREKMLKITEEKYGDYFQLNKENDIVLVINGDALTNTSYQELKKYNPSAIFILYIWDDIKGLFKKSHFRFFDSIYAYNVDDCKKYNFKYLPMFTEKFQFPTNDVKKYDVAIIATANNERIETAKSLYEKYKTKLKFYIYFYSPNLQFDFFTHDTPLQYQNYLKVLSESKTIFEMGRNNQEGPTTRFFDSLETKTKIITTNQNIKKYPVYGRNICILDKKMTIPEDFINEAFIDEKKHPIHIDDWMNVLKI